jgi:serine/threonine-protein kinase
LSKTGGESLKFIPQLAAGDVVGGRYRILRVIGLGGMSRVYLADDLKLSGKQWAIKESGVSDATGRALEEEASLLIKLSHPRLPRIVDFLWSSERQHCYLVMDYIQGIHLDQYLRERRKPISAKQLGLIGLKIGEGLHYLHSQVPPIIHRDIKPSNLLIDEDEEVRFVDFGIARSYKQDQAMDTVKLGTVGFAAPEQFIGTQSDGRADLYSLGAVLLFLGTGCKYSELTREAEQLFSKRGYSILLPIVHTLMQPNPEDRYSSADMLITSLQQQLIQKEASSKKVEQQETQREYASQKIAVTSKYTTKSNLIAVSGVASGVGVTHTAVAIAHTLSNMRYRVALIELDPASIAFDRIFSIVEGDKHSEGSQVMELRINRTSYFKHPTRTQYIELLSQSYDYIVCDLGTSANRYLQEEFMRADIALIVAAASEWRRADLMNYVKLNSVMLKREWICIVPFAPPSVIKLLRRELICAVHPLPLETDPYEPGEEMKSAITAMLEQWLIPRRRLTTSIMFWWNRNRAKRRKERGRFSD